MKHTIVGLGEILWDVYDDTSIFGGAPANFACHAAALGLDAYIKSAVGKDNLGDSALAWLRQREMAVDFVGVDPEHPTGTVHVRLDRNGHPSYEFAPEIAWDYLDFSDHDLGLAQQCDAVCFGTLAQRSEPSRIAIQLFIDATLRDAWRILDVNLRQNFYSASVIRESVKRSNALKLNDEEWPMVSAALDISAPLTREAIERLAIQNGLRCIALTRGPLGSWLWLDGEWNEQHPEPIDVVDTVGAGDAFTAALIVGLLRREPLGQLHRRASRIAAFVCTKRGATPQLPEELTE